MVGGISFYINLLDANGRLKTFEGWPLDFIDPKTLVDAGFYYTQQYDRVRCAYCSFEMDSFKIGDDPKGTHIRQSPICPFFDPESQDSDDDSASGQRTAIPDSLINLVYFEATPPTYPLYRTYQSRLNTYLSWPKASIIKPEALSTAGLFYTDIDDETVCFQCGGGLTEWEDGDDPLVEHARYFKKCPFIAAMRGVDLTKSEDSICEELSSISLNDEPKKNVEVPPQTLLCKVCNEEDLAIVFIPCGHLFACVKCAFALNKCAICRKFVTGYVRAYLS